MPEADTMLAIAANAIAQRGLAVESAQAGLIVANPSAGRGLRRTLIIARDGRLIASERTRIATTTAESETGRIASPVMAYRDSIRIWLDSDLLPFLRHGLQGVAAMRSMRGLTLASLSRMTGMGAGRISEYERDPARCRNMTLASLRALARAFDVDLDSMAANLLMEFPPTAPPPLPVTAAGPDTGPVFLPAAGPWENA